jgi:hypothetical protein
MIIGNNVQDAINAMQSGPRSEALHALTSKPRAPSEQAIRMECLELAVESQGSGAHPSTIVEAAKAFEGFVLGQLSFGDDDEYGTKASEIDLARKPGSGFQRTLKIVSEAGLLGEILGRTKP